MLMQQPSRTPTSHNKRKESSGLWERCLLCDFEMCDYCTCVQAITKPCVKILECRRNQRAAGRTSTRHLRMLPRMKIRGKRRRSKRQPTTQASQTNESEARAPSLPQKLTNLKQSLVATMGPRVRRRLLRKLPRRRTHRLKPRPPTQAARLKTRRRC